MCVVPRPSPSDPSISPDLGAYSHPGRRRVRFDLQCSAAHVRLEVAERATRRAADVPSAALATLTPASLETPP